MIDNTAPRLPDIYGRHMRVQQVTAGVSAPAYLEGFSLVYRPEFNKATPPTSAVSLIVSHGDRVVGASILDLDPTKQYSMGRAWLTDVTVNTVSDPRCTDATKTLAEISLVEESERIARGAGKQALQIENTWKNSDVLDHRGYHPIAVTPGPAGGYTYEKIL